MASTKDVQYLSPMLNRDLRLKLPRYLDSARLSHLASKCAHRLSSVHLNVHLHWGKKDTDVIGYHIRIRISMIIDHLRTALRSFSLERKYMYRSQASILASSVPQSRPPTDALLHDTMSTNDDTTPSSNPEMKVQINPQRASSLLQNISSINSRISTTLSSLPAPQSARPVRLVAVSKLKPAADILSLHSPPPANLPADHASSAPAPTPPSSGHLHFGENYVQELLEKSRLLPRSVKWHFIGSLQSNKATQVARDVDSLWAVESVDSEKKASLLNKGRGERNERFRKEYTDSDERAAKMHEYGLEEQLRVFIQVNTSGEDSKSGLQPDSPELLSLAKHIRSDDACPNLHLQGVMTIGAIARSQATTEETENEDFITLKSTRDKLAEDLGMEDKDALELSMGMSEDFESAVRLGSSEVRVGSTIFGERPAKKDAKVIEDTETEKR